MPPPGIRRHGPGWQTRVKVRGEWTYAQWPANTPLKEMIEWRKDTAADLRSSVAKTKAGTFAGDVAKYLALPSVKALPTYAERKRHLEEWTVVFKHRRRRGIRPAEIEAQRDRWFLEPRSKTQPPYAAASVNKRLRALSNLWTKLDGHRAPNPVREVSECEEPDAEARGLPYDVIEAIISEIPDTAIGVKKDGTRTTGKNVARPSQTKARLRVIAYTGLAHAQLKALTKADVDLEAGTMRVVARRKGRKKHRAQDRPIPTLLPLIPQAIAAFQTFDALNCWGPFSNSSMWKAFQKAAHRLGFTEITPYDLRHSLLSAVYAETRDLRVTGQFGGHRSSKTTERYTLAAVAPHVQAAADRLRERLAAWPPVQATSVAEPSGITAEKSGGRSGGQTLGSDQNRL